MALLTRCYLSLLMLFIQSISFTYQHHQMRFDACMSVYKPYEQRDDKGDARFNTQEYLSVLKTRGS